MSTPNYYYSLAQPAKPTALSLGQWILVLLVAAVVAAVTAGIIVFLTMRMGAGEAMPGTPDWGNAEEFDGGSASNGSSGDFEGGAFGNGGSAEAVPYVDHSDPRAVIEAYVQGVNTSDSALMMACLEPMDHFDDGGEGGAEPPEYPKMTMSVLDSEPWTSDDGEWMAFPVLSSTVMQEGGEVIEAKYGQWVANMDGGWWIPTVSAGNAPFNDSYMEWMTKLMND